MQAFHYLSVLDNLKRIRQFDLMDASLVESCLFMILSRKILKERGHHAAAIYFSH